MDARSTRAAPVALCMLKIAICLTAIPLLSESLFAAGIRTQNFLVTARNPDFARQVAEAAERYRAELATEWLGEELPPWPQPCPIEVKDSPQLGAGGATSFMFDGGRPHGWTMSIQGTRQRILDSVLPHEVTHTIFATHYGRPVPRWADEGACTTVEHASERAKQQQFLIEFLTTGRGIPFNRMFRMTEYPHDIMPLYSQGHSLAQFLISQGGKRRFVDFVGAGMQSNNWNRTIKEFYNFDDLSDLQLTWVDWVKQGSPALPQVQQREGMLAATAPRNPGNATERAQSPSVAGGNANDQVAGTFASTTVAFPSQAVAAHAGGSSWYARQHSQAQQASQHGFGPPSVRGVTMSRQAARAPQTQHVQERALEWNDESGVNRNAMASAPQVPPGYAPQALPVPAAARNRGVGAPIARAQGGWSAGGSIRR
jgi:hypothetical protein